MKKNVKIYLFSLINEFELFLSLWSEMWFVGVFPSTKTTSVENRVEVGAPHNARNNTVHQTILNLSKIFSWFNI